ncbi:nucleoside-diphosphate sugar epimerase/dehydratase [Anaeromyxobacter sp. Fw109-5]|uniref:nucleoside-diphosphate sugar epimerase/dehydratase n=1 Tax=Anaeromyxobacter sp. (strain Fw109-5) TaxID=404589 RepID=UPI0000ED7505|nr:nucleoside-diphosphate sugar epimerase/dehydratase [Anaeromyxobacter sp. Fw109-5]ABS26836.1 polysaccharide biosynthesis protein CapD [Anaeromyxobacter sp. Fw109-5]
MGEHAALRRARRTLALIALDGVAAVLALGAALWLRFDGGIPAVYLRALPRAMTILVAARLVCNAAAALHRWSFRLAGLSDALRVVVASLGGSVCFTSLSGWLLPAGLPRTVYVLEFFVTTALSGGVRFGPRALLRWNGRLFGDRGGARTIIIGDGAAAELLGRDLERRRDGRYRLVGFVTADASAIGWRIGGKRVLGDVSELPRIIRRHGIATVLLAERCNDPARVRRIIDTCADCAVRFKIVPAVLELSDRLSVSMLDDVSPADLLARPSVAFDEAAMRSLAHGRSALVTGAAGSIGSELCRQLARFGVQQLVMVDMNENELYFGARRLTERHPKLEVRTEIADVRDAERIRQLGDLYHPQDVFHAAAHKHVPLMESSPEEAVKNNVFGTLHVARMAHECGAERFVLISTDKAVKPTSVMGATKRVAELVARELGRSSRTQMTAVRFGNVFGSAGSVVPLFKEQISRGGPVTITHPDCTRYFMTIPEAVGLTLLAGLGGYGDLCVLDMGAPVRIADLAAYMIMLSGRSGEVPIVYTGLRPGEKLFEELLTEEEERSEVVRDRIRVTRSPPPPPDLVQHLDRLRACAEAGDRAAVLATLRELVPSYRPARDGTGPRGAVAAAQRAEEMARVGVALPPTERGRGIARGRRTGSMEPVAAGPQ